MLFQTIASISAFLAVVAGIETHGTPPVDFEVRLNGSDQALITGIKDTYEKAAARIALDRIVHQVEAKGIANKCLNYTHAVGVDVDARNATYQIKDCIIKETEDERIFFNLLAEDVTESDVFWKQVVQESDLNMTSWIAARASVKAYYNGSLTALNFAGWTLSPYADLANLHANPEHYYKSTPSNATDTSSEILEGWGGVLSTFGMKRTHFEVPSYKQPLFDGSDYPAAWGLNSTFPAALQRAGLKQLSSDGTTFGVLHIAVRDLLPEETYEGNTGIEVYSAVWYPAWGASSEENREEFEDKYVQDEAEHMVVEIINLTLQARVDLS
jgi:hypothetical protein